MWGHLAGRFFGSLRPGGPKRAEDEWARSQLLPGEERLWDRMTNPDRRHAAGVARDVERSLGHEASRPVLAAALLHDVGKIESGFRTYGRVIATLCGMIVGREQAREWMRSKGFTRRVGMYLLHPELGGDLLAMAGSDDLTVAWTREHHKPPDQWSINPELAKVLKDCDDD
jgi:hypothetical protein